VFKYIVRQNDTVLAVKYEVPVYELLGVGVEEGLKPIKEYLWDRLFRHLEPRKGYEKLWEEELKPLAERALRDTYKVFYYFDPKGAHFESNDVTLLRGSSGKLGATYVTFNLKNPFATVAKLGDTSKLKPVEELLGKYFVGYAIDELRGIVSRYGEKALRILNEQLYDSVRGYPSLLVASVKVGVGGRQRVQADTSRALLCFTCREEDLRRMKWVPGYEHHVINVDRLRRILEDLGYKLEIVEVREGEVEEGGGGRARWARSALGVIRGGEGTCIVFVERVTSGSVGINAVTVPCIAVDEVVEDARINLWRYNPLFLGLFLQAVYLGVMINEFTDEDRGKIAYEYYRMKNEWRWHGKVDLGRWEVHILSVASKPYHDTLVILDKATHDIYIAPMYFKGTLLETKEWMKRNKDIIGEWIEFAMRREDTPPELLKLLGALIILENLET